MRVAGEAFKCRDRHNEKNILIWGLHSVYNPCILQAAFEVAFLSCHPTDSWYR